MLNWLLLLVLFLMPLAMHAVDEDSFNGGNGVEKTAKLPPKASKKDLKSNKQKIKLNLYESKKVAPKNVVDELNVRTYHNASEKSFSRGMNLYLEVEPRRNFVANRAMSDEIERSKGKQKTTDDIFAIKDFKDAGTPKLGFRFDLKPDKNSQKISK